MEDILCLNVVTNCNSITSLIKIDELVQFYKERNIDVIAVSEFNFYNLYFFFYKAIENNLKPIFSIKLRFNLKIKDEIRAFLVSVYPKNYKSLFFLIKFWNKQNIKVFFWKEIYKLNDCFFIFEALNEEDIDFFYNLLINDKILRDSFFIGFNFLLDFFLIKTEIINYLVPFFNIHSIYNEENDVLKKILNLEEFRDIWSSYELGSFYSFFNESTNIIAKSNKNIYLFFKKNIEILKNNINLKDVKVNFLNYIFNAFNSERINKRSFIVIKSVCLEKLCHFTKDYSLDLKKKYKNVLEKELSIIKQLNYSDYFLKTKEIVDILKKNNLNLGPGRGSAVSSLVVFLLGITKIDPVFFNLKFERFLNLKRKNDLPDIDLDIEDTKPAFEILYEYFNSKNKIRAVRIVNHQKLDLKHVLPRIINLFKFDDIEDKLFIKDNYFKSDDKNIEILKLKYKDLFLCLDIIDKKKLFYSFIIHNSGLIIADEDVKQIIPIESRNNHFISLWDYFFLSSYFGIKKYDLLSLKNCLSINKKIDPESVKYYRINDVYNGIFDKKTLFFFNNGLTEGIFQINTNFFKFFLLHFKIYDFRELTYFISLNRPGITEELKLFFFNNLENFRQKKLYSEDKIIQVFIRTYGVILFEEQIDEIISIINECDFESADLFRKEIKNDDLKRKKFIKKLSFYLLRLKENFEIIILKNFIKHIDSLINFIYNEAHAVAYSFLIYTSLYIKASNYSDWLELQLNSYNLDNYSLSLLVTANKLCYKIKYLNLSFTKIKSVVIEQKKEIILGLNSFNLNSKSYSIAKFLIEERNINKFIDFRDILSRLKKYKLKVEKEDLKRLILLDFFQDFQNKENLLDRLSEIVNYIKLMKLGLKNFEGNIPLVFIPSSNIITNSIEKKYSNIKYDNNYLNFFNNYLRYKKTVNNFFSIYEWLNDYYSLKDKLKTNIFYSFFTAIYLENYNSYNEEFGDNNLIKLDVLDISGLYFKVIIKKIEIYNKFVDYINLSKILIVYISLDLTNQNFFEIKEIL